MNESRNNQKSIPPKRRKKSKPLPKHRRRKFFLLLGFCLLVLTLAIGLAKNSLLIPQGNQQRNPLFTNTGASQGLSPSAKQEMDETAWRYILVNKWNPIPNDYVVELIKLPDGQSVDKRIYSALQDMFSAAKKSGVYPMVVSGYRTTETQQRLLDEKIAAYKAEGYSAEDATSHAEAWVVLPGTSEHQLGIAIDINSGSILSTNGEVYEWLGQNSYQFGFIRRYSADKTDLTGVIDEPWHYRYVGVDAATEMYHQGLCLEEYLNKPENQRTY